MSETISPEEMLREKVKIAYRERSEMISLLTHIWPSHTCVDEAEPGWIVICVHTPHGQAGWHVSVDDQKMFKHLKAEPDHFDGHKTHEKYKRVYLAIKDLKSGLEWNDRFIEVFRNLLAEPDGPMMVSTIAFKAARIAAGMEPVDATSPDNEKA